MSIFENWFGNNKSNNEPNLNFGRYTDSNKSPTQYKHWEQALISFESEDFIQSLESFFLYLKDENLENVSWENTNGAIYFQFYQGSRRIFGNIKDNYFRAEAFIAKATSLNVGLLRRLVEKNYKLNYSRFSLDAENNIAIVFTSSLFDASPYKIYYALKEIATNADKLDDILIDEFDSLIPIEEGKKIELSENIKLCKYQFIISEIEKTLNEIDSGSLNAEQYPGAISYQLLDLCYKLDYLTVPEGFMMDCLERIHRIYFTTQEHNIPVIDKNNQIIAEYKSLLDRNSQQYYKEIYDVVSTFGVTSSFGQDQMNTFLDGELKNLPWYKDNHYNNITIAICGYIVGFLLFNYAIQKPIKSIFHLYYRILNNDYFKKLGYSTDFYDRSKNSFNQKNIKTILEGIIMQNKAEYKFLTTNFNLVFDSEADFCYSYLMMVRNLDFRK